MTGQTVDAARRALAARFKQGQLESAELDARLLTGAVLGLDLSGLIVAANRVITNDESNRIDQFAKRRLAGEPVARILGTKEFWGLSLTFSPATLVPRPDTETLVELALEILRAEDRLDAPLRVADLGTGSGAILLALLSELRNAIGFGTDVSTDALLTARRNATDSGLADRATFIACDYASGLGSGFDLIVSNPPYIRTADIDRLAIDVRDHDPHLALDGGEDGLAAYRALIPQAAERLNSEGLLIVEAGQGQSDQIEALMTASGLASARPTRADLGGIPRAVAGCRLPR